MGVLNRTIYLVNLIIKYAINSEIDNICLSGFDINRKNLRFVKISFDTSTYDKITKDRAAKFVDMLSAIGGTMGLLTGFPIISAVEIIYFAFKFLQSYFKLELSWKKAKN